MSPAKSIPISACRCAKSNSRPPNLTPARSSKTSPCASMIAPGRGAIPVHRHVEEGLPALRRDWILKRGDVEEYEGRDVKPQDNGYLSGKHRRVRQPGGKRTGSWNFPGLLSQRRQPLRAKPARSSRNLPMPAPASSRRKWNSSPSAKTWAAQSRSSIDESATSTQRFRQTARRTSSTPRFAQLRDQRIHALRLPPFSAAHPRRNHPGIRPQRSRRRSRHHSGQHQSSRSSSR